MLDADHEPIGLVLCDDFPLGVVSDDPFVHEAANVESFRPELRHGDEWWRCNERSREVWAKSIVQRAPSAKT